MATGQEDPAQPAAPHPAIEVFLSYADADKSARVELEKRLSPLVRSGVLSVWHRDMIEPGQHRRQTVQQHIDASPVIVLLLSADHVAESNASVESELALLRHAAGVATIVPVHWSKADLPTSLAELQGVPKIGTVKGAKDRQAAWSEVTAAIRKIVERRSSSYPPPESVGPRASGHPPSLVAHSSSVPVLPSHEDLVLPPLPKVPVPPASSLPPTEPGGAPKVVDTSPETSGPAALKIGVSKQRRVLQGGALLGNARYRLISSLGKGAFTSVWRADDRVERREVAIRALHLDVAGDKKSLARFTWTARSMHQISHPNLVELFDKARSDDGHCYYVMELVTGGTLHDAVLARRFSYMQLLSILIDVGNALGKIHTHDWQHRAVKPTNILLTPDGTPKLSNLDIFGGSVPGGAGRTRSLFWGAPELYAQQKSVDARADLYGLGMTAVFVLRGEEWRNDEQRPRDLIETLDSSEPIKRVLLRATEPDAGLGYSNAVEMCMALRAAIAEISMDGDESVPEPARARKETDGRHVSGKRATLGRQLSSPLHSSSRPMKSSITPIVNTVLLFHDADRLYVRHLEAHLAPSCHAKLMRIWHSDRTLPGEDRKLQFLEHMAQAHLVLLLVSASFNAQWDKQISAAVRATSERNACVVPVLLKPCVWDDLPFFGLQSLPQNGRPLIVNDVPDETQFAILAGELRELVIRIREAHSDDAPVSTMAESALFATLAQIERERFQLELGNNPRAQTISLVAENDKLQAENDKLQAENDKLQAENDKLQAENDNQLATINAMFAFHTKLYLRLDIGAVRKAYLDVLRKANEEREAPPAIDPEDTAQLPKGFVDRALDQYGRDAEESQRGKPTRLAIEETLKEVPPMSFGDTPLLSIKDAYFLVVKSPGPRLNQKLYLMNEPTRFGRAEDADMIVLPSPRISRLHARVERRGFSLVVVDENSTNHTFIIRRAGVQERERVIGVALLNEGDQLSIDEYRLMLYFRENVRSEAYAQELKRHTIDVATGLASDPFLRWQLEQATLTARRRKEPLAFALLCAVRRDGAPDISDDALVADLASELDRLGLKGHPRTMIGRVEATKVGIVLPGGQASEATALAQAVRAGAPRHMTIRHGVAELLAGDKDGTEALLQRALLALQSSPASTRAPR